MYDVAKSDGAHENNMFGSTVGICSISYWNFTSSREYGYSDLETVAREMGHQLDIDKTCPYELKWDYVSLMLSSFDLQHKVLGKDKFTKEYMFLTEMVNNTID